MHRQEKHSTRCWYFDNDGHPIGDGCPYGDKCWYMHPPWPDTRDRSDHQHSPRSNERDYSRDRYYSPPPRNRRSRSRSPLRRHWSPSTRRSISPQRRRVSRTDEWRREAVSRSRLSSPHSSPRTPRESFGLYERRRSRGSYKTRYELEMEREQPLGRPSHRRTTSEPHSHGSNRPSPLTVPRDMLVQKGESTADKVTEWPLQAKPFEAIISEGQEQGRLISII